MPLDESSPPSGSTPTPTPIRNRNNRPLERVANLIKSGKAKNIVILTGAGISTSAGIPDFRSPETGLYANLERLNLPFPEAVFEIGYFKKNPVPFWTLAQDLYPGKYLPTPTHYFLTLLHAHSILLRTFTQNIDTLETIASLPPEKIIEAHGSFASAHCLSCSKEVSTSYVLEAGVREGKVVKCPHREGKCGGLVKPDIVFFGEGLPERFFQHISDLKKADLVIVIGTSLEVHPFASLPQYCKPNTPRLLINREAVGPFKPRRTAGGADLGDIMQNLGLSDSDDDQEGDYQFWEGDADEGVRRLAGLLGWDEELDGLIKDGHAALREKWALGATDVSDEKVVKGEEESIDSDESSSEEDDDGKIPTDQINSMGRVLASEMKKGERPEENAEDP